MAEADIIGAIVDLLKADSNIAAAGDLVFGGELPANETANMPRRAIIVQPSGGVSLAAGSFINHDTQRVDLFCYGKTPYEAEDLRRLARRALTSVRRRIVGGCLIHWAEPAGGFSAGRDRDAAWPVAFQSFQVFYALQEV